MPVTGQKIVANNIIRYGGGFLGTVNKVMKEVRVILDAKVSSNMVGQLTPSDLKKLDHPYAKRHGPEGKKVSDPYYKVNRQSGSLLAAKKSGTVKASISGGRLVASAFVELDSGEAKHAPYVVFGTSKMIPRPVLEGSRNEVAPKAYLHIRRTLKNLTINFRGGK